MMYGKIFYWLFNDKCVLWSYQKEVWCCPGREMTVKNRAGLLKGADGQMEKGDAVQTYQGKTGNVNNGMGTPWCGPQSIIRTHWFRPWRLEGRRKLVIQDAFSSEPSWTGETVHREDKASRVGVWVSSARGGWWVEAGVAVMFCVQIRKTAKTNNSMFSSVHRTQGGSIYFGI